ncbi:hypothetical protein RHOFW104T7_17065 [Rhodanobacter thiooxydans]|uniref:Uncharacterized protein n=1 Tax=Rhodanobacter thiooxydans TaxID=416169 RepID=A0A154QF44_9GAMM|nr:hypothetical protein [Rhodanobacter thiooxydans]EIM03082.1 hypothetical protein UUA_01270 [Rhodanobacter thiooxydans LCS2]KZC22855.1 hypothetical protein RHOFW104T7_17065 [Rhodanobacter thiooxydans]MCW0200694.1 hypothetical protein [Rhodanobacter thiooxydans]
MKSTRLSLLLGMLVAGTGAAAASSGSLNEFQPKVLPVLVQVNTHGKVTDASPAMELPPSLRRLLRQNLDEMISKPATDHGRPVSSQFIANLVLHTTPRTGGGYDAQFVYESISPVPPGSWYWVHIDGHRLALASRSSFNRGERIRFDENRGIDRSANPMNYQSAPTPVMQNATHSAPSAPPASSPAADH